MLLPPALDLSPDLLRRLLRAKDRMDAASHEAWPVARLAEAVQLSPARFARCFRKAFGLPPHRYLLTRRIERASTLLAETDLPITDVAFQTAQALQAIVAKGAMPPLVLRVNDCRAACEAMRGRGVEITQEPVERYGTVDAGFRDPSGNGWKLIQSRAG